MDAADNAFCILGLSVNSNDREVFARVEELKSYAEAGIMPPADSYGWDIDRSIESIEEAVSVMSVPRKREEHARDFIIKMRNKNRPVDISQLRKIEKVPRFNKPLEGERVDDFLNVSYYGFEKIFREIKVVTDDSELKEQISMVIFIAIFLIGLLCSA